MSASSPAAGGSVGPSSNRKLKSNLRRVQRPGTRGQDLALLPWSVADHLSPRCAPSQLTKKHRPPVLGLGSDPNAEFRRSRELTWKQATRLSDRLVGQKDARSDSAPAQCHKRGAARRCFANQRELPTLVEIPAIHWSRLEVARDSPARRQHAISASGRLTSRTGGEGEVYLHSTSRATSSSRSARP
jgi:hypothetical protein